MRNSFRSASMLTYILGILLLSIIFLRIYINLYSDDQQYLQNRIHDNINSELTLANDRIDYLKEHLSSLQSIDTRTFEKHFAFIFQNDSLFYWTTDKYNPIVKSKSKDLEWSFLQNNNGDFLYKTINVNSAYVIQYYIPLKVKFPISNDYIGDYVNEDIFLHDALTLSANPDDGILPIEIEVVESFSVTSIGEPYIGNSAFIYLLLLESIFLIVIIIKINSLINLSLSNNWLRLFYSILFLISVRGLLVLFEWPMQNELLSVFDPKYFASSDVNSSFGELLINSFFLIALLLQLLIWLKREVNKSNRGNIITLIGFLAYASVLLIFGCIEIIYKHSQWIYDISLQFDLSSFKLLSILLLTAFCYTSFSFLNLHIEKCNKLSRSFYYKYQLIILVASTTLALLFKMDLWYIPLIVFLFVTLIYEFKLFDSLSKLTIHALIYLFVQAACLALIISMSISYMEVQAEKGERNSIANRIFNENDILTEYSIQQMHQELTDDSYINKSIILPFKSFKTLEARIKSLYLSNYFQKYDYRIHFFNSGNTETYPVSGRNLSQIVNPNFLSSRNKVGEIDLYLISSSSLGSLQKKYIYKYPLTYKGINYGFILIEFSPKKIQPENVFPELLVDKRFASDIKEIPYDYAFYKKDTLAYSSGSINFPAVLNDNEVKDEIDEPGDIYINTDGFDSVIFYKKDEHLLKFYSNFSFYFITLFLLIVIWLLYKIVLTYQTETVLGLNTKIQLFFALAFLIPLLSVSLSTISFVNSSFLKEIVDSYQERTRIAGENFSNTLLDYRNNTIDLSTLNSELLGITNYINSDLNLYNSKGRLISSSQPQIFEKNLFSNLIHPVAFQNVILNNEKSITIEEKIGNLSFQSTFIAVRSPQTGKLLGVLGSPFFKSNNEYELLLTDLLTNVFNIFTASVLIFLVLANLAGNILTKPLKLLKNKLAQVNLSGNNDPIEWKVDDEIGLLLNEYNQMLIKLEKSRLALRKTEKESAWREMAQQVAHEIKNPLTPMKLSLQHLMMKMDGLPEDTTNAKEKISAILSQVDNLSDIASSFSSFAKMPMPENDTICITHILRNAISFFKNSGDKVKASIPEENIYVVGDGKLMERICNNLIINALESSLDKQSAIITVSLSYTMHKVLIEIEDNGSGIPDELKNKVFLPNFTTKETGSGIGLAIAKRGIEHAGGKIWFETNKNEGTTFYIELVRVDNL